MHVCSLFGTGDRYELDCCTNVLSRGNTGKTVCSSSMARFVQSSAHSCSELEESTLFLVTTGFLEAPGGLGTKALPNTRSEVSAKLRLCQLLTLRRTHASLIRPFAKMETLKRMVPSQVLLADTCIQALSSVRGAKFTKNKNDQWSSAARVSVSKCINPWYMTHSVLPFTIREPRQVCLNCAGL